MKSVLLVSQNRDTLPAVESNLKGTSSIYLCRDRESALRTLQEKRYDTVFIDVELINNTGAPADYGAALQPFWDLYPTIDIVVTASKDRIGDALTAVRAGASSYLVRPPSAEEVHHVIERIRDARATKSELDYLRDRFWHPEALEVIHTRNPEMNSVFDKVRSVSPTKSTVLLIGETGTGKGVLAQLIHRHSKRRNSRFIGVHCGAIPNTLLESELFGHEKGAFTGAIRRKLGKFEIAKGGTIFLDEIGTITPSAQIKLLQVLQDGTYQRVGGEEMLEADVRVIAATNVDLVRMLEKGRFRKDLYYRLNVFPIEIPPLRRRVEDIPYLAEQILKKMRRLTAKDIDATDPGVMAAFKDYDWPGNIRELENLVERACILEKSRVLGPGSFPQELFQPLAGSPARALDTSLSLADARRRAVEDLEKRYLTEILSRNRGKIKPSAQAAGISPRQLNKLMNKYGIRKQALTLPAASCRESSKC